MFSPRLGTLRSLRQLWTAARDCFAAKVAFSLGKQQLHGDLMVI